MSRINNQSWVRIQKCNGERPAVSWHREVAADLVDCKQSQPLIVLSIVGGDLWVEILGDTVERDAVLSFDYKLFLEPKLFLEIFDLGQKLDDLAGDAADYLDLGEVLIDAQRS